MMASHKSGSHIRRRQLPSLSVDIADKQKHSLISHMTYKSSLEYLVKNEGTFTKALELIRKYPTLADHRSTEKIWDILSLGNKTSPRKSPSSYTGKFESQRIHKMPTISVTSDGTPDDQCTSCSRHQKLHIGILGLPIEHTETLKWSPLVCGLSSEAFVHCFKFKGNNGIGLDLKIVDALVFILCTSSLNNASLLESLNYAHQLEIPIIYIREPGFQAPTTISGEFTEKILLQQGIQQQQPSKNLFDNSSNNHSLRTDALPPISRSGYYYNPSSEKTLSKSHKCLTAEFKDALVYSGDNTDSCVQTTIKNISQSLKTRKNNSTADSSDSEEPNAMLKPPSIDNFLLSPVNSKRHNFAKKGLISNNVFDSSSSTESEDSVVEVSPARRDLKREESLDQETIYVLFPDRSEGSSGSKPIYVKWPPSEDEVHIDTSLTDMDDASFLSDSSVGFQDVDLGDIITDDDLIT